MWVLIVFIGAAFTLDQTPQGGPATAEFATKDACQVALSQIQQSFGAERPFDKRFQLEGTPGVDAQTRVWTIKGICVSKQ